MKSEQEIKKFRDSLREFTENSQDPENPAIANNPSEAPIKTIDFIRGVYALKCYDRMLTWVLEGHKGMDELADAVAKRLVEFRNEN